MEEEEDNNLQSNYENLLTHVVLPRVLPQQTSPDLWQQELDLLSHMSDNVQEMCEWLPPATVRLFESLKKIHMNIRPELVAEEIRMLEPGDTFGMFIRRQNCALMIHMPVEGNTNQPTELRNVIISTFPGNIHPKEVYGHSSDIQFSYPVQALKVKFSQMLRSEEFAHQLCLLYDTLPIEKKNRNYVHIWLTTILTDEKTRVARCTTITKKLRDEVIGECKKQKSGISSNHTIYKNNFFRRSNFYTVIKVFLQLSLTMELGPEHGRFLYKIVMLNFMTQMCDFFEDSTCENLNTDLITQLMAKMARRIEKLANHENHLIENYKSVVEQAKGSISLLRTKIDRQTKMLEKDFEQKVELKPLKDLNFSKDVYQKIPKLRDYLNNRSASGGKDNVYNSLLHLKSLKRHKMHEPQVFDADFLEQNDRSSNEERNLFLTDFENWILYKTQMKKPNIDTETLYKWSIDYASIAGDYYADDQLGISKMLLVRLKLLAMMDRIAAKAYPMLREHRSGIDPKIFDILLLPQAIDMKIAHELQMHFKIRNEKAKDPGLIEEVEISSKSFSVKFASENAEMQQLREEIIELGEENIKEKYQEWERNRERVRELRNRAARMSCDYRTIKNHQGRYITEHHQQCKFCEITSRINRIKLQQYERPLPKSTDEQNAIVFELRIPEEIAMLRDVLHITTKYRNTMIPVTIKEDWDSIVPEDFQPETEDRIVNLGSTTEISLNFHHVDKDFDYFIIENGSNCIFHAEEKKLCKSMAIHAIKNAVTLNVEPNSSYSALQWTLNSTAHTQNQVLARQSQCPQNLTLAEFKNFGSLRADGYRLQLRKLFAMIETESLSFDQSSVLSLILQTIWETGVNDDCDVNRDAREVFIRDSHKDFTDPKFTAAMIDLLIKFVEQQKCNWVHPVKLLMVAFIAVRIFELNYHEIIIDKCVMLLNKLRAVLVDWMDEIENVFHKMENRTQTEEQSLRSKLVLVSIAAAVTFSVSSQHKFFEKIFTKNSVNGYSAPRTWLLSIITLNNNIMLNEDIKTESQSKLRIFMRLIRNTGIHIETKMKEMIESEQRDVIEVIKQHWALARNGKFDEFYFALKCPHILVIDVLIKDLEKHITIDLINGTFLVNNLPVSRLPANIQNDPLFQHVFQQYVFEVQPDSKNSFSTVHKYNDCCYEFGWSGNSLIITEHRNNGMEIELIPSNVLKGEIPELLIENHSHWWNKNENTIEFRPKNFTDDHFSSGLGVSYELNVTEDRLKHIKTRHSMLDIKSGSYEKICNHLLRLERPKFVHVLIDENKPTVANVELVRMNLKFKVDCTKVKDVGCDMLSNEFSGLRVSLKQNCGTLYGLNHGLLLENIPDAKGIRSSPKLLILPHSKVRSSCEDDSHVNVHIDLNLPLRNPPFHQYQVDQELRQLRATNSNFSAWFYLAQLHAITSHGEIEPLTGMSGTERALQILQSSFVWSSAPYDGEVVKTLQSIAELSPKRRQDGDTQHIDWPKAIPRSLAQDSFVFIAKQLMEDSQRLSALHFPSEKSEFSIDTNLELNKRDYLRCLPLKPNLRVQNAFIEHDTLITEIPPPIAFVYANGTRTVSSLYHHDICIAPDNLDLKTFLTSNDTLDGLIHIDDVQNILNHTVTDSFVNLWISLYEVARSEDLNDQQANLIWSLFAHERNEFNPILALQAVAKNPDLFRDVNPPNIDSYATSEATFNLVEITNILRNAIVEPSAVETEEWNIEQRELHNILIETQINLFTTIVTCNWPCDRVNLKPHCKTAHIDIKEANELINQKLLRWNNNRKLHDFIDEVEYKMLELQSQTPFEVPEIKINHTNSKENWPRYDIDFEEKISKSLDNNETVYQRTYGIWYSESGDEMSAKECWSIYERIVNTEDMKHLIDAGMCPRTVPSLVLPQILSNGIDPRLKTIIGALAIAIANEQQQKRIEFYSRVPRLEPLMMREMKNRSHSNWNARAYPEWLLFEIEQNLTIRQIQIKVAQRMIDPPKVNGKKNSVMQLNMGEGKTAVIVPILAAVLADGNMTCQITVLKSLFATNLKALRQYLGGMLNRRIYTLPCRRDMPVAQCVSKMLDIYKECQEMKGVILTLAEYRLSFQLKIYESVYKNHFTAATEFLTAHQWINANVRNILDESDAILHAKHQLIYTVGNQLSLDGGAKRWSVGQAVLKRVPYHMKRLHIELGDVKMEYDHQYVENGHVYGAPKVNSRPDVFVPCRILDESIYNDLKNLLIDDFIEGRLDVTFPEMTASIKNDVRIFLSEKSAGSFDSIINNFTEIDRDILMILSGLLRFEVLKLALMKRWRVNYGVNEKGNRKMAIPFKAKDVAAEMTEFGHPDVALCFTQLSYYYSGLTDVQLLRVFDILKSNQNAPEIYEKWIGSIPDELVEPSIQRYSAINLSDSTQRDKQLFPLLRFNMYVIDFWLSVEVFPREAKTFEKKLMCTAWDLCSDHLTHHVTGFSGTNDTKNILPLPIIQNDLPELEETNENVRRTLLRSENQSYKKLLSNVSGRQILEQLVEDHIPVFLDSGALMLELSNQKMAKEWLELAPSESFDAAVYFDERDVIQTVDRKGVVTEFDSSVYRENLERCLVYLDDVHTRGTDLKFPLGWKACVTLSGDIARDKTVQACMRMRQLGEDGGHSIAFWASHEADTRIRNICNLSSDSNITNEHVIAFICENSKRFETENTVHWATAAHNYTKKMSAHKRSEEEIDHDSLASLFNECVDDEFVKLADMYGGKEEASLIDIASIKFRKLVETYQTEEQIAKFIQDIGDAVHEKLKVQATDVKRFKNALDEEQEKELEHEVDEQRQIERPPEMKPFEPKFNEKLHDLFTHPTAEMVKGFTSNRELLLMSSSLSNTQLFHAFINEDRSWSNNLFVTEDFNRVIKGASNACDDFLRPVWWIAGITIPQKGYRFILLSSYECDRLVSTFRNSKEAVFFMYRPRLSKFHSNLLHDVRLQVTGMEMPFKVDLRTAVEISMYAGSMYFKTDEEQDAYCGFLGFIPRERKEVELKKAFEAGIIKPNGFVQRENRKYSKLIEMHVGQCRFTINPADLVIRLIIARHQFLRNESHVASIMKRGFKLPIKGKVPSLEDIEC